VSKGVRLVVAVIVSTLSVAPIYFILSVLAGDLDNDFLLPALMIATVFAFVGVLLVGLPGSLSLDLEELATTSSLSCTRVYISLIDCCYFASLRWGWCVGDLLADTLDGRIWGGRCSDFSSSGFGQKCV
jgi:hypothetical protein